MSPITPMRLVLQAFNYAVFMALVWYLSFSPPYAQLKDDQAIVTLAFGHTGKRVEECVARSQTEMAELAPNMRVAVDCPRERSPITVQLSIDDKAETRLELEAPGLYNDQGVDFYHDVKLNAGRHVLALWMNDDVNVDGPTHTFRRDVNIEPADRLVISFDATTEKFLVR